MLEAWVDMNRLDCDHLIRHVFFSIHVSRSTTLTMEVQRHLEFLNIITKTRLRCVINEKIQKTMQDAAGEHPL